ncbi:MAG: DUF4115 domain-containing protein [Flavobacteriales bacterium]|nr:DUF4115 domain-containing protein [Flavobacteriales bacterium]
MDPLAQRLKAEREQQGLSIRDLSVVTKVREPYIEALERGRYDILPAVYIRSFVKTIGSALGITHAELEKLMRVSFEGNEESVRLPRAAETPAKSSGLESTVQRATAAVEQGVSRASEVLGDGIKKIGSLRSLNSISLGNRPRLVMAAAVLAVLILIIIFVWVASSSDEPTTDAGVPAADVITVPDNVSGTGDADSIRLDAVVSDSAWITITMDGERTQQQVLVPGTEYNWSANKKFVLNVTNVGGVRFIRNGEPLPLFGRKGEAVRSIVITRTDVVSSAQPPSQQGLPVQSPTPQAQQNSQPAAPIAKAPAPKTPAAQKPAVVAPKPRQQPAQRNAVRSNPRRQPQQQRKPAPSRRSMPLITPAPTVPPR